MTKELEVVEAVVVRTKQRAYRSKIPAAHQASLDTRIMWLWNQRFGTVQTVYQRSPDALDQTAAMLILQAIMAKDLESISQIFSRLEGGALSDEQLLDRTQGAMRL